MPVKCMKLQIKCIKNSKKIKLPIIFYLKYFDKYLFNIFNAHTTMYIIETGSYFSLINIA